AIIKRAVQKIEGARKCKCASAMKYAIVTDKKVIPAKVKKDLKPLIGKYV
ncbi:MAG: S-methyl-5'-thioadenosine phosphorylase, partial [Deltaproteobacteria bacterium]|nr:S-methyl-5'-thioadenosine phosphorylase [Deltaproteobacteria bacterium]